MNEIINILYNKLEQYLIMACDYEKHGLRKLANEYLFKAINTEIALKNMMS